jgi:hypothetical protein
LGLDSVTPELIEEYSTKWLKARKLQERESSEVKRILREKLGQPHMRDLARNPMQLAILLSLIHMLACVLARLHGGREHSKERILPTKRCWLWLYGLLGLAPTP